MKNKTILSILCLLFCCCERILSASTPDAGSQGSNDNATKLYNNPLIPAKGVCDPHVHIFNNKAYLFATHDEKPGNTFYAMYDWWVWSSTDLVNWELDFTLKPKDMWTGPTKNCWAVDAAERDGKYYFYVSSNWNTCVAVSDKPSGPYKDALGKALYTNYDPTVFIDDDKDRTPYLITSGFPYKIAKMNNDMISLAEEPKELIHTSTSWDGDGGFMHKRNGIYYINGHGCKYSTATNIYGPYQYRGKFHQDWIDHPTIFNWNNQTFCAFGVGDNDQFFRKTYMTYIYYRDNGDIVADEVVSKSFIGVGQYDCSKPIQAEWYFAASDGVRKIEIGSGFGVDNLTDREYIYYPRVLNMAKDATLTINVSSKDSGGVIEIHQDRVDGKLLGKINVPNTGNISEYQTVSTNLNCAEGLTNIYLVYRGSNAKSASLDWFKVSSTGAIPKPKEILPNIKPCLELETAIAGSAFRQIEAEDFVCYSNLQTGNCDDAGNSKKLSHIQDLAYCTYKLDFGSASNGNLTFQARVSSGTVNGGRIEIRLGGTEGELLGECVVPDTGGWHIWTTQECNIKAVSGVKDIYIVFRGGEGYLFDVNWFRFVR